MASDSVAKKLSISRSSESSLFKFLVAVFALFVVGSWILRLESTLPSDESKDYLTPKSLRNSKQSAVWNDERDDSRRQYKGEPSVSSKKLLLTAKEREFTEAEAKAELLATMQGWIRDDHVPDVPDAPEDASDLEAMTRRERHVEAALASYRAFEAKFISDERIHAILHDAPEAHASSSSVAVASSIELACDATIPVLCSTSTYVEFAALIPDCATNDLSELFSSQNGLDQTSSMKSVEAAFNDKSVSALVASFKSAAQGHWDEAKKAALASGYALCKHGTSSDSTERDAAKADAVGLAWFPTIKGQAFVSVQAFRCSSTVLRGLILEIPHPYFDRTRGVGVGLYPLSKARALVVSGTHRCALHAKPSKCTGSSGSAIKTNCADRSVYHNSDTAHSSSNMFYVAHTTLTDVLFPKDLVVSLHSTKQANFVVSDGTSFSVKSSSAVAKIGIGLAKAFPTRQIEACNAYPKSPSKKKLTLLEQSICGATNIHGRHLNGAKEPCTATVQVTGSPLKSSGRFVHIEQPVEIVKPPHIDDTVAKLKVALENYYGV